MCCYLHHEVSIRRVEGELSSLYTSSLQTRLYKTIFISPETLQLKELDQHGVNELSHGSEPVIANVKCFSHYASTLNIVW